MLGDALSWLKLVVATKPPPLLWFSCVKATFEEWGRRGVRILKDLRMP